MSRRLIVRAEAEADLTKAALWYDKREPGLGLELTLEVRAAIRRALEDPLLYLLLRERPEVRRICQGVFLIAFSSSCEMTPLLCLPSSMPPVMTDIGENGYDLQRVRQSYAHQHPAPRARVQRVICRFKA